MTAFTIKDRETGDSLLTVTAPDIRRALEDVAARGVTLRRADLRGANLANAMLDGLSLHGADLSGANLTGTNLSEGTFIDCRFANTDLYGACLAFSQFVNCDFSGALCGGTDAAGARWERCLFSTLSAMQVNFIDAETIAACAFHDEAADTIATFERAPVLVTGLEQTVLILDESIRVGGHMLPLSLWQSIANDNWPGRKTDGALYNFLRRHGRLLAALMPVAVCSSLL